LRRHPASRDQAETGHQCGQEEQLFAARFHCLMPLMKKFYHATLIIQGKSDVSGVTGHFKTN
jgi:hypothetical protein